MVKAIPASSTSRWDWLPILALLPLLAWQGWMTLTLFGGEAGWETLLDDRPVVSGFHPLHQYHGYLGAQALLHSGRFSCYDPAFQAGYPKTPIFDSGSRFSELFMLAAGGEFSPAAYKIGVALLLLAIPLLVLMAARAVGLNWWETLLATLLAQLVMWGVPARELYEYGQIDLLMAAVLLLAQLGLLIRFDRKPGFFCWPGLVLLAAGGWFAHPLLFGLLIPLLLVYYLSAGVKHRSWLWHVGLWSAHLAALGVNAVWLNDWVHHWWIRSPFPQAVDLLHHRTFRTLWEAPLWGEPADRALAVILIVAGLLGVILLNQQREQRPLARLFGLAAFTLLGLALLGISWEPLGRIGTSELLVPALWFLVLPAACAVGQTLRWLAAMPVQPVLRWAVIGTAVLLAGLLGSEHLTDLAERAAGVEPLLIGLDTDQQELLELLKKHTSQQARILWEDQVGQRDLSRWTALLALRTDRYFIGGLDPDIRIDHSQAGFIHSVLAGRPLAQWSDTALQDYCRRYNIGWVAAWSTPAVERFRTWTTGAEEICEINDHRKGFLFRIRRERPSFALHGQAELVEANGRRLVLANVVPQDGKVVLSFHYQAGLRVTPSRVQVEREPDVLDPIPLLRLRVNSPVSRLVITWEDY